MLLPYQCIQKCGSVLLAASLSRLDSFSFEDCSQLASWTCPTSMREENSGENTRTSGGSGNEETLDSRKQYQASPGLDFEPPAKKRRISDPLDTKQSISMKSTDQKTKQQNTTTCRQEPPAIIALTSTRKGEHVIAVIGEEKSIRVFEHDGRGHLQHISQRIMPKRPCAIALSADESTIICADKFGDVYSLPLLLPIPSGDSEVQGPPQGTPLITRPFKPFIPAANDLTVHSVRNRKALQNQIRQKRTSEKLEPQFERKLLLGHVSMLTDIVLVKHNGQNYIITADRDEHIRISRGIPQTHIIEGYCLGHKEFVSRLCVPKTRPHLLISGGGDDEIYVWNWLQRKLVQKVSLRNHAEGVMGEIARGINQSGEGQRNGATILGPVKIAVSHIQYMKGASGGPDDIIIVISEGLPAIFIFSILGFSTLSHYKTLRLEGNPLDVVIDDSTSIIVSIDSIHEPGSASQRRADLDATVHPLQVFQMKDSDVVRSPSQFKFKYELEATVDKDEKTGRRNISDLLYSLQNLRKIGGEE